MLSTACCTFKLSNILFASGPSVTPVRIAAMEGVFRDWAAELMAPLLRSGGGDWIQHVANPLPARATALVIGLPLDDVDDLLDWAMTGIG